MTQEEEEYPITTSWFQRTFGDLSHYTGHSTIDDSVHLTLLVSFANDSLEGNKFTAEKIKGVVDTFTTAIAPYLASLQNLNMLTTDEWWSQLSYDLKAKLKLDQAQSVVQSLKSQVKEYTYFTAPSYTSQRGGGRTNEEDVATRAAAICPSVSCAQSGPKSDFGIFCRDREEE